MLREKIFSNIYFNGYEEDKFKSNMLTVKFILPLESNTASKYAIIPYILTMGNREYETIIMLNKKLNSLYGSNILVDVKKKGAYQIISVGINFIDKRYMFGNKDISEECCNLLFSILNNPHLEGVFFDEKNIKIAKRQMLNKINIRVNNKNLYAIDRCNDIMFENEKLQVHKYGCKQDINFLDRQDLKEAYYDVINKSRIEIIYIGSGNIESIKEICKSSIKREYGFCNFVVNFKNSILKNKSADVEETMKVSQSKLVIGFKCEEEINEKLAREFMVMDMLFGRAPFSKLFLNVREKMNLCYNCNSIYDKYSNTMLVFMGLDSKDKDKALKETLKQLKKIQEGMFGYQDLDNIKSLLNNIYLQSKDSLESMTERYFSQLLFGTERSIDEEMDLLEKISKDEIMDVAGKLKLDTVYLLKGGE